ncbi:MAG: molybdopterin-dependent oxidoreductase [Alphaproteobacteria bacterium]
MFQLPKPGESVRTTCAYCGVGCGIIASVDRDGMVSVKGDPEHPANYGRLCSKGMALGETLGADERLLTPKIGDASVDWNTALEAVAQGFRETIDQYGPDSVAFYVSGQLLTEDYYVANKLMKGFIGSANIDTNSRLCMASSVAGHRKAFGTDTVPGTYADLELADVVVLVGSNLAWCHPVLYQRLAAAKEARPDLKVVLIDPRRTRTDALADVHLRIRPDGDGALFAGLLSDLNRRGCLAEDFIRDHTSGIEAALAAAEALSWDDLLHQTGLSRAELDDFYALFAANAKVVTVYSQGVNQSSMGTDKVSAILNVHLATGRIGKPGQGPFSVTGQPNAMGGREVGGLANMLAGHLNIEDPEHRQLVQDFWQSPTIAERPGLKAVDLFRAIDAGDVRAVWIMATNPAVSVPEAQAIEAALAKCPLVVVSEVLETTDTARWAHVRLPAAGWAEKDGTVTNSERRISRQRALIPAEGQAMPDWWIINQVAKRMGYSKGFNHKTPFEIFCEAAALSGYRPEVRRDYDISAKAAISSQAYEALQPFQWPASAGSAGSETRFFAQGGFFHADRRARFIAVTPDNAARTTPEFPFVLNTGRIRDQWHTMTRTGRSPRLSSHLAEPFVEIHPSDAEALLIEPADIVRVSNGQGHLLLRALITDAVSVGSVFVPMHWTDQYAACARVDALVPGLTDPFSGQPAFKNVPVNLQRFNAQRFGFAVLRDKPKAIDADYWAMAKVEGGLVLEFAQRFLTSNPVPIDLGSEPEFLSLIDSGSQVGRQALFDETRLSALLFTDRQPVEVPRRWATDLLTKHFESPGEKLACLAGRPRADVPDQGATVCACESVGLKTITMAILDGCESLSAIGEATGAGTNCGSCRAELKGILDAHLKDPTSEAAAAAS